MKRAEVEVDQMPGQDSFLDVVTNIVGVLILLVLVVGLRTSHSVQGGTEEAVAAAKARGESEYRNAYNSAVTSEHGVRELVQRVGNAHRESEFREEERAWMSTNIAAAEKEIEARRARLTTDGQRDFDLRQKLATAQATLDELTREQVALMSREPAVEELECQPTPMAKTVTGKEIHVLLSDDHIAVVPLDDLLEMVKTDAQANVWRMKQGNMERTIGPVNGFRLRYFFVKEDVVGKSEAGTFMTGSVSRFSHCYVLPVNTPAGEPAQEALAANSDFFHQLQQYRPEGTTVTIWTYAGNFERLREMKRVIRQVGYQIAVRPLPKGMPIGASRHGSSSLSE